MENKKLEKNLIFYIPGQSGAVFTYQAGNVINDEILHNTMETLAADVDLAGPVKYIEERRLNPRLIA